MSPSDAAKRTGMAESALREINRIPPKMLVKAGSTLLVPRGANVRDDVSERLADSAALNLAPDAPPLRRVTLKAGKGDTVAVVAARYKVRSEQVAQWNKVGSSARFKPGQAVIVYTAFKPAAAPAKATVATRAVANKGKASVRAAKPATPRTLAKDRGGKGRNNVVASAAP
jgi:membrane-bound lytic murein transglycosylase D